MYKRKRKLIYDCVGYIDLFDRLHRQLVQLYQDLY